MSFSVAFDLRRTRSQTANQRDPEGLNDELRRKSEMAPMSSTASNIVKPGNCRLLLGFPKLCYRFRSCITSERETGSSMVIEHCATRRTAQPPAAQRRTQRGSNRARPERRIAQMSEEQREAQRERNRTRQRIRRARMTEEQQARQRGIWRDAARRRRAQLAGHNQSEPTTHATTPDNEADIATTPVVLNNKDGCSNISWAWPNIECTKRSAYIRHPNILNTDRWRYVLHDYLLSKTSIIPKSYNMRVLYDQLYKHGLKGVAPHIIKPSLSFVKASLRVFEQLHSVYTNHDLQLARAIAQTYFALIQKRGSPQGEKPCRSCLIFTA